MTSCVDFVPDSVAQLGQVELLRPDAVQRREGASEDVVKTTILVRPFDADDVPGLFHDADDGGVPPRIPADVTELLFGEVEAARAEADDLFDLDESVGQGKGFLGRQLEQVEREALGGLGPDAGKLAQLIDELLDGWAEHAGASGVLLRPIRTAGRGCSDPR